MALALQLEHERRLHLEQLLLLKDKQRVADRRAASLALGAPPIVACKPAGYHLVKLPSSIILAVPELYDMHYALRTYADCAHRVPAPSKVRAQPRPHARVPALELAACTPGWPPI